MAGCNKTKLGFEGGLLLMGNLPFESQFTSKGRQDSCQFLWLLQNLHLPLHVSGGGVYVLQEQHFRYQFGLQEEEERGEEVLFC